MSQPSGNFQWGNNQPPSGNPSGRNGNGAQPSGNFQWGNNPPPSNQNNPPHHDNRHQPPGNFEWGNNPPGRSPNNSRPSSGNPQPSPGSDTPSSGNFNWGKHPSKRPDPRQPTPRVSNDPGGPRHRNGSKGGSIAGSDSGRPSSLVSVNTSLTEQEIHGPKPEETQDYRLQRKVGLLSGISLIVGTMIGSGIFISPTGVLSGSGSVGLSLVVWVIGGLISLCGALAYAELGTLIPLSGGEYIYLLAAFRSVSPRFGPLIAFLFSWMNCVVLRPCMVAIIALTFGRYCTEPFFDICNSPPYARKCAAALAILVITLINCWHVKAATIFQNICTVLKLGAIAVLVIGGFVMLGMGNTHYLSLGFTGTQSDVGNIALAFYHSMWAYDGWNTLNYAMEELIDVDDLPKCIAFAIPIVTVCYLLTNISYFAVMSPQDLIESPAVAVLWGNRVLGVMKWIIPFFVACSTLGAANGTLFSSGRLNYAASREGHITEILSMVHETQLTPLPAIIFTSFIALIMIIPSNVEVLIEFFSFAVWIFYGLTMVALLVVKWLKKGQPRETFTVPVVIPIFMLLVSLFLVITPLAAQPKLEYLYVAIFILFGVILYVIFVHFAEKMEACTSAFDPVTAFLMIALNVQPSDPADDFVLRDESEANC